MQVLTWAHKRHRLIYSLASIDSNVAARAATLEQAWSQAPALLDAPGDASPASHDDSPRTARAEAAVIPVQLAGPAAAVETARVASLAPAKPMKGAAELAAANAQKMAAPKGTGQPASPEEAVPEYLQ